MPINLYKPPGPDLNPIKIVR